MASKGQNQINQLSLINSTEQERPSAPAGLNVVKSCWWAAHSAKACSASLFWLFAGSLQFTALANIGTQHCLQSTARPNMESQQCDCWDSQCSPIMDELAPHTALSYNVVWVPVRVTGWPVLRWGLGPDHSTLCEKMTARWINAWAWNPPDLPPKSSVFPTREHKTIMH